MFVSHLPNDYFLFMSGGAGMFSLSPSLSGNLSPDLWNFHTCMWQILYKCKRKLASKKYILIVYLSSMNCSSPLQTGKVFQSQMSPVQVSVQTNIMLSHIMQCHTTFTSLASKTTPLIPCICSYNNYYVIIIIILSSSNLIACYAQVDLGLIILFLSSFQAK